MAASIIKENILGSFDSDECHYGLDKYISEDTVMFHTSAKMFRVYQVSENRCIMNWPLKGRDSFLSPVVWSNVVNKMVALMRVKKKRVVRLFAADESNPSEWETMTIPYEVLYLIDVDGNEPLVITSGGMVGWLSLLKDHALSKLADEALDLKRIHSFSSYKIPSDESGSQISIFFVCKRKLYQARFQQQKLTDCATPVCSRLVQCYCISSDGFIYFIDADNSMVALTIGPFNEPRTLQKLDSNYKPVDIIAIDKHQLLIAANDTSTAKGSLIAYDLKFHTFTPLTTCADTFLCGRGKRCLAYSEPYLVIHLQSSMYTLVLSAAKSNLRYMLGRALKRSNDVAMDTLESKPPQIPKQISSSHPSKTEPTQTGKHVGNVKPAHLLSEMCEKIIKRHDEGGIKQLLNLADQLDDTSIVLLIEYILSSAVKDDKSMEISDQPELESPFTCLQESNLISLLSVSFTDSVIATALTRVSFEHVMTLFQFLSRRMNLAQKNSRISLEQVARWCLIILDVFHNQIVRRNDPVLIKELYDKIDEHVELMTNLHEVQGLIEPIAGEELDNGSNSYEIQKMIFTY